MDDLEYRVWYSGQLMCPNPREYYQMTRSYQSLRNEYDLLHSHEFTEEEVLYLTARLQVIEANKGNDMLLLTFFVTSLVLGVLGALLLLMRI